MEQITLFIKKIIESSPDKIILSKPASQSEGFKKIIIQKKSNDYQVEKLIDKKVFHQAIGQVELIDFINVHLGSNFLQLDSFNSSGQCSIHVTRKGKTFFIEHKSQTADTNPSVFNTGHNREKNYIFHEGQIIEPLIDMGIFTKDGQVIRSMYDKYRQINRFIEMVDDVIKKSGLTEITVIDFGCGKSYLSFLLYYYLDTIMKIKVRIIGLDLMEDVIQKCNSVAQKYTYTNLSFQVGDIQTFRVNFPVDMVITLHACDTATDYALLNSVVWNARMIFSVPCCQHELNNQITSEPFSLINRYGIIQERVSAALTDAIRANLLMYCGYKTQLLEFIDFAHTPKNILIRAVRSNISHAARQKALSEVIRLSDEFHLTPTLLKLLENQGLIK